MKGSLNRVSLVTEIDAPFREPHPDYFLHPAGRDPDFSRVVFHEATHYWQQLSQTYLLMVAAEDWDRLQTFVETGRADEAGHLNRTFRKTYLEQGFSALDLAECASRYWDILNIGPHNLVESALANGVELNDETRRIYEATVKDGTFRLPNDGYTSFTVELAMRVVGGAYARPYFLLQDRTGAALVLFPLLAHWALQTPAPVTLFDQFADLSSRVVNRWHRWESRASRLLGRRVLLSELREEQMKWYWYLAGRISKLARKRGFPLWAVSQFGPFSSLGDHPIYRWAFNWSEVLGRVAVSEGSANDMKHLFPKDPEALAILAVDRMLALPGGPEREMLANYLRPPIHRFSDDRTWFTGVDPDRDANVAIAEQCMEIHTAWEDLRTALRGY